MPTSLRDTLAALRELHDDATIFAERVGGAFRAESLAASLVLSDADSDRPVKEVAEELAPGLEYFLEVEIARDVVDVWAQWSQSASPSIDEVVRAVIFYAENDAYLPVDQSN